MVWCRSAKIATVQRIEIEDYMSQHQHDTNCNELWLYFQTVINWVKATFPKYRSKLMKGLEWGIFYNKYGTGKYDPKALEARIIELIEDYRNGYISNQQIMLMEYAKSQHFPNPTFFIDDGYSGVDFSNRPGFQKMLAEIEAGHVEAVITKDLSRLGRNSSLTGFYINYTFPQYGVRYIAISDHFDTIDPNSTDSDMAGIKNWFNVFYSLIPQTDSYSSCKSYTSIAPSPLISAAFRKSAADRPPAALPVTR